MDFQEARRLADVAVRPTWAPRSPANTPKPPGTFAVSTKGWEDADYFGVVIGPMEKMGAKPTHLVSKRDESVRPVTALDAVRVLAMTGISVSLGVQL